MAKIEKGQQLENMTNTEGWKQFSEWLKDRENEYTINMKKADNYKDVVKHQAFLNFIDTQKAFIKNAIQDMYNELKKSEG